jgi:GTP-binding protein Era
MYQAGFVGLIGQPNAGKSTLMNSLVQEKISIVTPKPQTTRRRILGMVNRPKSQIIFVDAPGVIQAAKGLNGFLALEAQDVISQSDFLIAVLAVDTKEKEEIEQIIELINKSNKKWIAVINKVDLMDFRRRVEMIKEICLKHKNCLKVVEFSSTWKNDAKEALEEIYQICEQNLPTSPAPLYDVELFTPHTLRELVGEIIREQCFEVLHQELPYSIAVRIQKYDEDSRPDLVKIYAEVLVSKENHKAMVIGQKAATIKQIGMMARKQIEKLVDKKVFLQLDVAVRENWFENKNLMKELGYVMERKESPEHRS